MIKSSLYLKIFFAVFFLIGMAGSAPAAISSKNVAGVKFSVTDMSLGKTTSNLRHAKSDKANASQNKIDYIAITYTLLNQDPNKKINLDKIFKFALLDEFNNQYLKIPPPVEYTQPVFIPNKNYPSIYPHEQLTQTIFFEAPIKTATKLSLLIKTPALGGNASVNFMLPIDRQKLSSPTESFFRKKLSTPRSLLDTGLIDRQKSSHPTDLFFNKKMPASIPSPPAVKAKPTTQSERWVEIVYPHNGQIINRGEATQIHVESAGNPTSLILAALGTSYYDQNPESQNVYDLRIPYGYYTGALSVNIIAEWANGTAEPEVISDTIFLDVKSPDRFLKGTNQPILEYFR